MPYQGRQPGVGVRDRFIFTATTGQTSFSGNDSNGLLLKYDDATYVDVFINGTLLVPVTDYTATTKTSVVLIDAAAANDVLEILAYGISSIADTVSASSGGTFAADVTFAGDIDVDGTTNLDIVDIDGAVNMAQTALVTGVLTTTAATVHTNGITMPDNAIAKFGTDTDMQIFHSGSTAFIRNSTGSLVFRTDAFRVLNEANSEQILHGDADGAVTLYYNNSQKLATAADGISVTGDVAITSGGTLDVFNSGNTSTQLTALFGADNGGGHGRTNSTVKSTVIGVPHYTNSEESVGLIVAGSTSSSNFINIGGGASVTNAATEVSINTAANQTTTGGTKRLTVNSAGDINVLTGNLVVGTSGKGISFYNYGTGTNIDNNLLNDYEEGTWSPTLVGLTFASISSANYTKIGNRVLFDCQVQMPATSATQVMQILTLPFATSASDSAASLGYTTSGSSKLEGAIGLLIQGATVSFYVDGGPGAFVQADFSNAQIRISGQYQTNS